MRWALVCDLTYGLIGLAIMLFVWSIQDAPTAVLTAVLMTLCYLAGGQKFRPH